MGSNFFLHHLFQKTFLFAFLSGSGCSTKMLNKIAFKLGRLYHQAVVKVLGETLFSPQKKHNSTAHLLYEISIDAVTATVSML